ncbi:MAG TPA: hypothetical protein VIT67_11225 [Povalibacter sp.]
MSASERNCLSAQAFDWSTRNHEGSTMASKNPPKKTPRAASPGANEGEGNKTADRHYREASTKFVNSERGKREIRHAGDVSDSEEADIERAEQDAKARAREHDPEELRNPRKPG